MHSFIFPWLTQLYLCYHTQHFFKENKSTLIYLCFNSLNPRELQNSTSFVSNDLSRKLASEFDSTLPPVSSYLSPDCPPGFLWFAMRSALCFVHMSTSLAETEFSFFFSINTFSFKKSCVLPLILGPHLYMAKMALDHSLPGVFVIWEVLLPADLHRLQSGGKRQANLRR